MERDNSDYQIISGVIRRWARMAVEASQPPDISVNPGPRPSEAANTAVGTYAVQTPVSISP